jgi:NhaP-type Na+/H+ or K+/H+ antiporter
VAALVLAIRPVTVLAVLGRRCMGRSARAFAAIFGVRGTASLLYAAIAVQSRLLSSTDASLIVWITSAAVATSVCIFGVAATPLTARLLPGE